MDSFYYAKDRYISALEILHMMKCRGMLLCYDVDHWYLCDIYVSPVDGEALQTRYKVIGTNVERLIKYELVSFSAASSSNTFLVYTL